MTRRSFTAGGSLDGAVRDVPAAVTSAVTTERDGTRSYYQLDASGAFTFAGFNQTGAAMAKFFQAFRDAARRDTEMAAELSRARGCSRCGGVYGSSAAYTIHLESGREGSRCLPDGAHGQLVQVDGVWCEWWQYPDATRK